MIRDVVKYSHTMKRLGLQPLAYRAIINVLAENKRVSEVIDYYKEMKQKSAMDVGACNIVLDTLGRIRKPSL
jgi:pentatricopeptide repeat protein